VEYSEVRGKMIKALKVDEDSVDPYEARIEFTDGTSFAYAVCHQPDIFHHDLAFRRCSDLRLSRARVSSAKNMLAMVERL